MLTFELGTSSSDAITINPIWNYRPDMLKNEFKSRTLGAYLYKTTLGSYEKFNINTEMVTSEHMTIINSWWEDGSELLLFVTSDSITEVNSVILMNDSSPIDQFQQNTGYFKGSLELGTY